MPFSASVSDGPARGFAARGWLGQFLVVLPKSRVVAVRMRKMEPGDQGEKDERDAYPGFGRDLARAFP